MTSRRTLRTDTRALSASDRTTLVMSRRRSSVRAGIDIRISCPAVFGVSPRSDLNIAFSMIGTMAFSHGVTVSVRASSVAMFATWFNGISEP